MNRNLLKDRVVLTLFDAVRCVLLVLRCDVTRSSWFAAVFVLCAFKNYLDAIAFLSHCLTLFNGMQR